MQNFNFPESWLKALSSTFCEEILANLHSKIYTPDQSNTSIFPSEEKLFRAFELTPFDKVKVLILGQDPYHKVGQANGLAFSVDAEIRLPPSLKNIYLELHSDIGCSKPKHGNLDSWARQGVLLLNATLSVKEGKPNSHKHIGWKYLTNKVISRLSERGGVIFVLWGNEAQKKITLIDQKKNNILCAPHPSPLSSYRGFFGSRPFSKINSILVDLNQLPINWEINPSD